MCLMCCKANMFVTAPSIGLTQFEVFTAFQSIFAAYVTAVNDVCKLNKGPVPMNAITQNILRDMQNQVSKEFGLFFYGHHTFKDKLQRFKDLAIHCVKMRSLTFRIKAGHMRLLALEHEALKQAAMDDEREMELMHGALDSINFRP